MQLKNIRGMMFFAVIAIILAILSLQKIKAKDKPNYDWSKIIYFDPKLAYSKCYNDILVAGYRIQGIPDTLTTDSTVIIDIQYKIHRNILGIMPSLISMRVFQDTIFQMTFYYWLTTIQDIKNLEKSMKQLIKIKDKYGLEQFQHYDERMCGSDYEVCYETACRYESFKIFMPLDYDKSYFKFELMPNDNRGFLLENLYKAFEDALVPEDQVKKKKKKK